MGKVAGNKIVAQLDLVGCPIGTVLNPLDPDQSVEERFFAGWENALTPPPYWRQDGRFRVVMDRGRPVLEHMDKSERCLLTGDPLWRDYTVETKVRQLVPTSHPNPDDEHNFLGRSGIVFRCQTLRHYYFLCLEGKDRIVLYRRDDEDWKELGSVCCPLDPARYYRLRVEVWDDRILCFIDGTLLFDRRDKTFPTGKCGIRTNTLARFDGVTVTMTEEGYRFFVQTRDRYERELRDLQEQNPKPALWKTLDVSSFPPRALKVGYFRCPDVPDLLLLHPIPSRKGGGERQQVRDFTLNGVGDRLIGVRCALTAMDLDGEILWRREGEDDFRLVKVGDMDGDGREEITCVQGEHFLVLEGKTGEIRCQEPLPPSGPFVGFRNARCDPAQLYIVNLRGTPFPSDIVIMDGTGAGGHTLWAYACDLKRGILTPLWTTTLNDPPFGHHLHFYDVDGDGREEVLAGCFLLDDDGRVLWQLEGSEYWGRFMGGRHPDVCALGPFNGDDPDDLVAVFSAGSEGVFFADGRTGKVRRHHPVGHAQSLFIADFRPDLPGPEILVGNRWGNYGLLTLFRGNGEKLTRFQPDYTSQGGPPVNWRGDGQEFIFLFSTEKALGLYDGWGRKVVEFPREVQGSFYGNPSPLVHDLTGDPRDEIVFITRGKIWIYTQDRPFEGEKVYAPRRERRLEYPVISTPEFREVSRVSIIDPNSCPRKSPG